MYLKKSPPPPPHPRHNFSKGRTIRKLIGRGANYKKIFAQRKIK